MEGISDLEIQNRIMSILYENRHRGFLATGQIRRQLPEQFLSMRSPEFESHLRQLKDKGMVREKKENHKLVQPKPAYKTSSSIPSSSITSYSYEIRSEGIQYVEYGFSIPPKPTPTSNGNPTFIVGNNINFGVVNHTTINYHHEIHNLVNDQELREELIQHFNELNAELEGETIRKSKIVQLLTYISCKVADKGMDKVLDLAFTLIGQVFKQNL